MRNLIRISGLLVVLFSPSLIAKELSQHKLTEITQNLLLPDDKDNTKHRPDRRRKAEYRRAARSARELSIESSDLARRLRYNSERYTARRLAADAKKLYDDILDAEDSRRSNRSQLRRSYRDVRRSFRRLRRRIDNRRYLRYVRKAYRDLTYVMDEILY